MTIKIDIGHIVWLIFLNFFPKVQTFHHQPWPVNAPDCEGSQKGQRKSLQLWNFEWKNWGRVDEVNICWFHKQDCLGKGLPWFNFKCFSFQTESWNRLLWAHQNLHWNPGACIEKLAFPNLIKQFHWMASKSARNSI